MPEPLVSVVMPVYNAAAYLRQAVDSLLAQTLGDFELLAFDDGSSDPSVAILREYAARDSRVRLFANQHAGYVVWLNEGLRLARGEFYARMDADDVCMPQRLRMQAAYLEAHPQCGVVGAEAMMVDPEGWPLGTVGVAQAHEQIESRLLAGQGEAIVHPTAMFRRQAMLDVGGYAQRFETAEDLDLFLRLALVGQLANLPQVLLHYRRHLASISHRRNRRQLEIKAQILKEAYSRRGRALPPALAPSAAAPPVDYSPAQYRITWVRQALNSGHLMTAAKHGISLLRHHPARAVQWAAGIPLRLLRRLLRTGRAGTLK